MEGTQAYCRLVQRPGLRARRLLGRLLFNLLIKLSVKNLRWLPKVIGLEAGQALELGRKGI